MRKSKTALERVLIVPDVHRPYHDERAWRLMLKAAKDFKPNTIVIIGDFADFYTVSSHSKDPRRAFNLVNEVKDVRKGLAELNALGAKRKIFIAGNHCDRLTRYLRDKAPELFEFVDIPKILKLDEAGWEYVPYKQDIQIGKLNLTHDVGNAGRYAVYKALDGFQHSNITGHSHRLAYIVEGNMVGEYKLSAQFGWLGDVEKIDYMHRAKAKKDWALGFGIGHINPKTGIAYMVPVPIVNYTCVVNGTYYEN